jgi:hypothetical protein
MRVVATAVIAVAMTMTAHAATIEQAIVSLEQEASAAVRWPDEQVLARAVGGESGVGGDAGEGGEAASQCFTRYLACVIAAAFAETPLHVAAANVRCLIDLVACLADDLKPGPGGGLEHHGSGLATP